MGRATTVHAARDTVFDEDGCAGFHLTDGGTLALLRFDDGEHRLMVERGDVTFGLRLTDEDVKNLRVISGHSILRVAA